MAKVSFPCPACGATVRAPAEKAGKRGRCPKCGQAVQIPTAGPCEGGEAEKVAAVGSSGTTMSTAPVAEYQIIPISAGYEVFAYVFVNSHMLTAAKIKSLPNMSAGYERWISGTITIQYAEQPKFDVHFDLRINGQLKNVLRHFTDNTHIHYNLSEGCCFMFVLPGKLEQLEHTNWLEGLRQLGSPQADVRALAVCFNSSKMGYSPGAWNEAKACWEVFWRVIDPKQMAGCRLYQGSTSRLNFTLAVTSPHQQVIDAIESKLSQDAQFQSIREPIPFLHDSEATRLPLLYVARVDDANSITGEDEVWIVGKDEVWAPKSALESARPKEPPRVATTVTKQAATGEAAPKQSEKTASPSTSTKRRWWRWWK